MRIGIVGAGGVGGLLAGYLLNNKNEVYLSARGEHAATISRSGLKVEVKGLSFDVRPTEVITNNLQSFSKCDLILLTVKLYDLEEICKSLKPHVNPHATLVTMQNGVDALEIVGKYFSEKSVAGGSIVTSARIENPGLIVHEGENLKVTIENKNAATKEFVEALRKSGVSCDLVDDIQAALWKKLIRLASVSGVTCLTRQPFGWVDTNAAASAFLMQLITEAYDVAVKLGVKLPCDTIAISYEGLKSHCTYNFKPSMLLDLERKKRLEVNYLSGAVSRLGKKVGVPTPCSDAVVVALTPYVDG